MEINTTVTFHNSCFESYYEKNTDKYIGYYSLFNFQ